MNTFKRKALFTATLMLLFVLAGCGTADKRYMAALQDTNDRIERSEKAKLDADNALAQVLAKVAEQKPELAAMAVSNVMLARAIGAGGKGQAFVVPERPKSTAEELRAWASIIVPGFVQAYGLNRSAYTQVKLGEFDAQRYIAGEHEQTARISEIAGMAVGLKPGAPNVTTTNYTFGRDGNVGGSQHNDNSTYTLCNAGSGAPGGGGGNGGNGGGTTGAGAPGAAGASGGTGGNAC